MDTSQPIAATFEGNQCLAGDLLKEAFFKHNSIIAHGEARIQKKRSLLADKIQHLKLRIRRETRIQAHRAAAKALAKDLKQAEELRSSTIQSTEKALLALCLQVTQEVIGEHVPTLSKALERRIKTALQSFASKPGLTITVNPCHQQELEGSQYSFNEDIQPGCAEITTDSGKICLSWEQHFYELSNELKRRL